MFNVNYKVIKKELPLATLASSSWKRGRRRKKSNNSFSLTQAIIFFPSSLTPVKNEMKCVVKNKMFKSVTQWSGKGKTLSLSLIDDDKLYMRKSMKKQRKLVRKWVEKVVNFMLNLIENAFRNIGAGPI